MRKIGETLKPMPVKENIKYDYLPDRSEKALFKNTHKKIVLVYDQLRRNEMQYKKEYNAYFNYEREIPVGECNMVYTDYKELFKTVDAAQERMHELASIVNREYVNFEIYVRE